MKLKFIKQFAMIPTLVMSKLIAHNVKESGT